MLTDGRTHGRTDDGGKVITIAHPEQSSGELKRPVVFRHTSWVDNHLMIITAKYGSHHFSGYGENAIKSFSHYKSMGAFCCHGN